MKFVLATLLVGGAFSMSAFAITAKIPMKNYICGSLKFKGDKTAPIGAPTLRVSTSSAGVKVLENAPGAPKPPKIIPMKLKRSMPEVAVYGGGDYEVVINRLKTGRIDTVEISKISNRDWSAKCSLPVAH